MAALLQSSRSDRAGTPLKAAIVERAQAQGFDCVAFVKPAAIAGAGKHLNAFLKAGYHGDMAWMATTAERRSNPQKLWPQAKSIIVLGMNYAPETDPLAGLANRRTGSISVYARGKDYHDVIKRRLKAVARWLAGEHDAQVKVFVDTAPVMEKPLAAAAGLGWQGKHTNLVSRQFGSWLFLGSIFTDLELAPDPPARDACGSCTACLDICPTQAFPAPRKLDARRCISYLTIEYKGHIPVEFRAPMGNRIYGCDDCLAACPWNKFARAARERAFHAPEQLKAPLLADLAMLDDEGFRALFRGSPVKRTGRDRFVRNVLIAIGNSKTEQLKPVAAKLLGDRSPLVRAMAVWAYARLAGRAEYAKRAGAFVGREKDEFVLREWRNAAKPAV